MDAALEKPVKPVKARGGKFVALCFVSFFGVIVAVNMVFLYMALSTQPGVVTKNSYEKGLAFNELLDKAKSQPNITQQASYSDGALRWVLMDEGGAPIVNATINAKIIRPVQDGYDFEVKLGHVGGGIYEVKMTLPLKGKWEARLSSKWNNKQYQTAHQFIVK